MERQPPEGEWPDEQVPDRPKTLIGFAAWVAAGILPLVYLATLDDCPSSEGWEGLAVVAEYAVVIAPGALFTAIILMVSQKRQLGPFLRLAFVLLISVAIAVSGYNVVGIIDNLQHPMPADAQCFGD